MYKIISISISLILIFGLIFCCPATALAEEGIVPISENGNTASIELDCTSAVLMEASTGKILYAMNENEALPPASVTKIMTLLLVMEAIEDNRLNWTDKVTVSENAASMGGSQIFLEVGESMTVDEMVKSVVIASANDAACALAEHIAGSQEEFVSRMNTRAKELGMQNSNFENTNGLDDTAQNHVTSALDIAIMSRALIKHKKILEYSSIWMDTVRDGKFGLTNTNRLVRFYRGCNGLKTGSTKKAGFCVSATAERGGMTLIAVIMGAPTSDLRNASAARLLDYGFANYELYTNIGRSVGEARVLGGNRDRVAVTYPTFTAVVKKGDAKSIKAVPDMPNALTAPIKCGEVVGKISFYCGDILVGEINAVAESAVEKITFGDVLWRVFGKFLLL